MPPKPHDSPPPVGWQRAPLSHWAYQNIQSILPNEVIGCGVGPAMPMSANPVDITGISFGGAGGRLLTVDQMLDETSANGFMVIKNGEVVVERYRNGLSPDGLHLGQSISKAITAAVVGVLIDEGLMDPNAPISTYMPELEATAWRGALLSQVMNMTTGVKYAENYDDPASDMGRTDVASGWSAPPADSAPGDWPTDLLDQILSLHEQSRAHGAAHEYRSIEGDLLGMAAARAAGVSVAQLVSTRIWAPMGAEVDALVTLDPKGAAQCDGGVAASMRDFARFGLLFLSGGYAGGRRVLPQAFVDEVRRGPHEMFDEIGRVQLPNGCFRNMFWVEDVSRETLISQGVYGQMIYIAPELDLVAVKLSSWAEPLNDAFTDDAIAAIHAIAHAIDG
jgi:CubicO group peptidase (beta-lactamase class C family)